MNRMTLLKGAIDAFWVEGGGRGRVLGFHLMGAIPGKE